MPVLIEGISVVIRADALLRKFPRGWDAFELIVPNQTLCTDNEIVRVGFMDPNDVESFVKELQAFGLEFLRFGEAIEIAVVDQLRGPTSRCGWLEFGHATLGDNGPCVAACRLRGSHVMEIFTPHAWKFEDSLSSSFGFVSGEYVEEGLKYIKHENGLDVYTNPITDKEVYVGRTVRSDPNKTGTSSACHAKTQDSDPTAGGTLQSDLPAARKKDSTRGA